MTSSFLRERAGSTAEMAQHMASRLAAAVDAVECRSVEEVESVSGYEAVIVGSAIHNQAWLSPAAAFFSPPCTRAG